MLYLSDIIIHLSIPSHQEESRPRSVGSTSSEPDASAMESMAGRTKNSYNLWEAQENFPRRNQAQVLIVVTGVQCSSYIILPAAAVPGFSVWFFCFYIARMADQPASAWRCILYARGKQPIRCDVRRSFHWDDLVQLPRKSMYHNGFMQFELKQIGRQQKKLPMAVKSIAQTLWLILIDLIELHT